MPSRGEEYIHPDTGVVRSVETGAAGNCLFSSTIFSLMSSLPGFDIPQGRRLASMARGLRESWISWLSINLDRTVQVAGNTRSIRSLIVGDLESLLDANFDRIGTEIRSVEDWLSHYGSAGTYTGDLGLSLFSLYTRTEFGRGIEVTMTDSRADADGITLVVMSGNTFTSSRNNIRLMFHRLDADDAAPAPDYFGHFTALDASSSDTVASSASASAVNNTSSRKKSMAKKTTKTKKNLRQSVLPTKTMSGKRRKVVNYWTSDETRRLEEAVEKYDVKKFEKEREEGRRKKFPNGVWKNIARAVGGERSANDCSKRWREAVKGKRKPACKVPDCEKLARHGGFCTTHSAQQPPSSRANINYHQVKKGRRLRYAFLLILVGDLLESEIHLLNHLLELLVYSILHTLAGTLTLLERQLKSLNPVLQLKYLSSLLIRFRGSGNLLESNPQLSILSSQ